MTALTGNVFALPDHLDHKSARELIAADESHLAVVSHTVEETIADLDERLALARRAPARGGTEALERDQEVHRLTGRLRMLRRFGLDLCLGRTVGDGPHGEVTYVGRLGLTDDDGRRLLVDWRSPAAEPFFGATHARPMGLASRRRYRWTDGRITDYWDEVFTAAAMDGPVVADDESAFIASLGTNRSARMRDVLGTIAADQDAIIRADSRGALVVDGGPGTGKTVVALHRAAYLLYSDPRLGERRGGVLFVGPHQPYLDYVADVLPALGEDGVRTCTLRDLVAEGSTAQPETDPEIARLKASTTLVDAIEAAVGVYEEPPTEPLTVATDWVDLHLGVEDWAEAFAAPPPGTPHNDARDLVWEEILTILVDQADADDDVPPEQLRASLRRNRDLVGALGRAWPLLDAADLVGDLWTVPAYLRLCAPGLAPDDVRRLQRADATAWTVSDLPLLDAARHRLGDPDAARRRRASATAAAAEREAMCRVVDDLIAADDSELQVMSMLRGQDLRDALAGDGDHSSDPGGLAGPFAHVVVDEAQELTDAEWAMVLRRCPAHSLTVVGDRAQARHGFTESWPSRLGRVGLGAVRHASLRINYRTPEEVMAEAEPVIRAVIPDANVPTSIRSTGVPVEHGAVTRLDAVVEDWLASHEGGIACVIGDPRFAARSRVRSLTPELAKGLEFDLVVLVDPDRFGSGVEGAVDRYVAMTRATHHLVVLTSGRA